MAAGSRFWCFRMVGPLLIAMMRGVGGQLFLLQHSFVKHRLCISASGQSDRKIGEYMPIACTIHIAKLL